MDRIAVLIPCYNESLTIQKVVTEWKQQLPDANIYVYDNNSTDNTAEIAKQAGAIVCYEYLQGKGNVIRRMFRDIDAECYIMVDGDDTYSAENSGEMVDLVLNKNVDMVVGDRLSSSYFNENKRPFHNFGNTMIRFFINRLFKADIKDIMTGCRAFSYQFVKTFPVVSQGFEIETEMTIHAIVKNLQIHNTVITYRDRPKGSESKLNTFSDGVKVLKKLFQMFKDYKPFAFWGSVAAVLSLISILLFLPVFIDYIKTGLVMRFPTLITSGFIMMSAIISMFVGMILQSIQNKDRQQFEYILQQANIWKCKELDNGDN